MQQISKDVGCSISDAERVVRATASGNGGQTASSSAAAVWRGDLEEATVNPVTRRSHQLHWNGRDLPAELRELPAGQYVLESIDMSVLVLSQEEEEGIEAAMESCRQGRGIEAARVREILDAVLKR